MTDAPSPTQGHMTPADVLNAAAERFEHDWEWTQEDYDHGPQCYCMLGAVLVVQNKSFGQEDDDAACQALAESLFATREAYLVARWNDEPGRTKADVVAALRKAAALAAADVSARKDGSSQGKAND